MSTAACKKIQRLKKRSEFVELTKRGKRVVTKGLILQGIKSSADHGTSRVGFTVTRKVGNAVIRNRIKRRFRVIANEVMRELAKSGYDYVIIGRKATISRPFASLVKDLKYAFHQIHK